MKGKFPLDLQHNKCACTAERKQLGALVACGALAGEAERAAAARAKLHDAYPHNPYYDFLYALHLSRHHYRKGLPVPLFINSM